MYKLQITAKAKKELKSISKIYKYAIAEALEEIKDDPFSGKPLTKELAERFSYKVGSYRIVYKINKKDKTIIVITAGHRATVYN